MGTFDKRDNNKNIIILPGCRSCMALNTCRSCSSDRISVGWFAVSILQEYIKMHICYNIIQPNDSVLKRTLSRWLEASSGLTRCTALMWHWAVSARAGLEAKKAELAVNSIQELSFGQRGSFRLFSHTPTSVLTGSLTTSASETCPIPARRRFASLLERR